MRRFWSGQSGNEGTNINRRAQTPGGSRFDPPSGLAALGSHRWAQPPVNSITLRGAELYNQIDPSSNLLGLNGLEVGDQVVDVFLATSVVLRIDLAKFGAPHRHIVRSV